MSRYERRSLPGIKEEEGKLVGYAARFNELSRDLGGVKEMVHPEAFNWTLKENPDVRALIEHNPERGILGRTKAGTLTLEADEVGLRAVIDPPDTTAARDLIESVKRGDISGMSFAFRVPDRKRDQRLDFSGDMPVRHLLRVELREVSIVAWPAFEASTVEVRKLIEECGDPLALHRLRLKLAEAV